MTLCIHLLRDDSETPLPGLTGYRTGELSESSLGSEGAVVFLRADSLEELLQQLAPLRSLSRPRHYLQPAVLISDGQESPKTLLAAVDGVLPAGLIDQRLGEILRGLEPIHDWINALPNNDNVDEQLSVRLLRHLGSRDQAAEPLASISGGTGYLYPALMPYFGGGDAGVVETLAFLEQQQFLSPEFVARAHFCFHCDCAFLNFEEVCTQCGSADLETQELVHHFRCGHVAPLEEYQQGDILRCGKCGHELRHIGVDYDKPSLMYRCNNCDHRFQEPEVRTTCYRCGRRAAPENQRVRRIARYQLTPLGENAARFGMESLFTHLLERDVGLVPWSVFERLLELEKSRIQRFRRTESCLLLVSFSRMESLYAQLGARAERVFESLSNVFSQVLRNTDVVTSRDDSLYVALLAETSLEDAEVPRRRLMERLTEVLAANLDDPPGVEAQVMAVDESLDANDAIGALAARQRD